MSYKDKDKQREYMRVWVKARRDAWLALNGPCIKCGSFIDLEVHHVDPTQKVTHRVWSWAVKRRDEELSKCRVLCCDCHKRETATPRAEQGVRGVHRLGYRNKTKPWEAQIWIEKKMIHIGCYSTIEEAAEAYNRVAVERLGDAAVLNQL